MTLVDTSAWIEYLRPGVSEVGERVETLVLGDEAAFCDVVLLELWNGARGAAECRRLEVLLKTVNRFATPDEAWNLAHRLARKCRETGRTFPPTDILVAACAAFHGIGIEHKDKHLDELIPIAAKL